MASACRSSSAASSARPALAGRAATLQAAFEPIEIELVLAHRSALAATRRLDPLGAQGAAQPVHVDLEGLHRRRGR